MSLKDLMLIATLKFMEHSIQKVSKHSHQNLKTCLSVDSYGKDQKVLTQYKVCTNHTLPELPYRMHEGSAAYLNGVIYLCGGYNEEKGRGIKRRSFPYLVHKCLLNQQEAQESFAPGSTSKLNFHLQIQTSNCNYNQT